MASSLSIGRRVPQQERGERRVAQLLGAAAEVIAEKGYDAATMTEFADRACASIGAVYQYFPNKQAVARALRAQYGEELEARWTLLNDTTAELSVKQLADHFIDVMVQFMEEHPAYFALLDAPLKFKRDPQARSRLRERFSRLFLQRRPSLTPEQAFRTANVTIQIIKSMNELYADARPRDRQELIQEYKLALSAYLGSRLAGL